MKKIIVLILLIPGLALATGKKKPPPESPKQEQEQDQHQKQYQGQHQESVSLSSSKSAAGASADNDNEVNTTDYVDVKTEVDSPQSNSQTIEFETSPTLTLVPQGHTAGCQRTYGISFGNTDSAGGIGWPFRDKDCDYDNEAADAFASGQHKIGWYWNCHKKSAYKPFKDKGESVEKARDDCYQKMLSLYVVVPPRPATPPVQIDVEACSNDHPETHNRIFEKCQQGK